MYYVVHNVKVLTQWHWHTGTKCRHGATVLACSGLAAARAKKTPATVAQAGRRPPDSGKSRTGTPGARSPTRITGACRAAALSTSRQQSGFVPSCIRRHHPRNEGPKETRTQGQHSVSGHGPGAELPRRRWPRLLSRLRCCSGGANSPIKLPSPRP